jgi:hypothetical protein
VADLLVRQLPRGAHQAVARVADHDVDPVEHGSGAINDAPDRRDPGTGELGQPQPVAVLDLQVVHDPKVAHGPRDAVAAREQCSVMMRPKPLFTPVSRL